MSSVEYRNLELIFIEQLKLLISREYDPEKVAKFAFEFYLDCGIKLSGRLDEVVYSIMMMDAGPEFEMTKIEIKEMIKEKLGVDL